MKQKLGKVSISPKGEWSSATAYECLDTVNFGGGSWLAKRANTAVSPVEGDDWMQLSAKGADAEVTKDSIVEALGYEPEKAEGTYELIETITVTEGAVVSRTQTPDGRAYKFRDVVVKAVLGDTAQTPTGWFFKYNGSMCGYAYYSVSASYKCIATRCHLYGGYWWSIRYSSGGSVDYGTTYYGGDSYTLTRPITYGLPYINNVYSASAIAAGTTLKIYAIWA